jgi:hypothetical protein
MINGWTPMHLCVCTFAEAFTDEFLKVGSSTCEMRRILSSSNHCLKATEKNNTSNSEGTG